MGSSNIKIKVKLIGARLKYLSRSVLKRLPFVLSMIFLAVPVCVSIFLLIPPLFARAPVFQYFIENYTLPLTYEYEGKVILLDPDNNNVDQNVTVNIGGYSLNVDTNTDFVLKFTSKSTNYVYATVEYYDQNNLKETYTYKIVTHGDLKFRENICIHE